MRWRRLIFHETLSPPRNLPPNVKFIDLGAGGLSQLIGLKMGEELGMPVRNASLLIRSMRFMLEKWPRLVAEYKPAFGTVFEQYVGEEYSHWGYTDRDMIIGNLPLFIEHKELLTQDIVSYSFGDMDALYLRGQWTVHRNRRDVNTIWKACPHLGDDLQKEAPRLSVGPSAVNLYGSLAFFFLFFSGLLSQPFQFSFSSISLSLAGL